MNYKAMPRAELIAELEAWEGKFEQEVEARVANEVEEERHQLAREKARLERERGELAKLVDRFNVSETYEDFDRLAQDVHFSRFLTELGPPWRPARFSPRKREMLAFIAECTVLLEKGRKIRRGEDE